MHEGGYGPFGQDAKHHMSRQEKIMNRTALGIAVACIGLAIGGCNNNPNNGGGEAPGNPSTAAAPAAPANPPPAPAHTAMTPPSSSTAANPAATPATPSTAGH
jgi:hypothetical protein